MKNFVYILLSVLFVAIVSCKENDVLYNTAARAGFEVADEFDVGDGVSFTDVTEPTTGTEIVSYLWEFGDDANSTSTEQNPTFVYKKDGIYTVNFTGKEPASL